MPFFGVFIAVGFSEDRRVLWELRALRRSGCQPDFTVALIGMCLPDVGPTCDSCWTLERGFGLVIDTSNTNHYSFTFGAISAQCCNAKSLDLYLTPTGAAFNMCVCLTFTDDSQSVSWSATKVDPTQVQLLRRRTTNNNCCWPLVIGVTPGPMCAATARTLSQPYAGAESANPKDGAFTGRQTTPVVPDINTCCLEDPRISGGSSSYWRNHNENQPSPINQAVAAHAQAIQLTRMPYAAMAPATSGVLLNGQPMIDVSGNLVATFLRRVVWPAQSGVPGQLQLRAWGRVEWTGRRLVARF